MPTIISKSKYMLGLQCPKLLWHAVRKPESIPAPDKSEQARFDQGHEVGRLAQLLWPGGQAIAWEMDFKEKIAATRAAMPQRKPIYEATFAENQVYAQVDILSPAHGGAWNIYEVKSSTSVKPQYLPDVAFQKYVCESAGIRIGRCFLVHINTDYVRKGSVDPEGLFNKEEVTRHIKEASSQIKANLKAMQKILAQNACPEVKIGPQCSNPYECPLRDLCWGFIPETSVFDLYRGGAKSFALLKRGIFRLRDIPAGMALTEAQAIQVQCAKTSKPHIQAGTIRRFLGTLSYPLQFLDFETFNPTIPLYDGVRPYQQIPFQYSLHVVDRAGAKPLHYEWLAEGRQDPRPGLLAHLKHDLRDKGSIVAFNMVFEKSRLTEMAKAFPENKAWIHDALERIVDLITPFRQLGYYHPDQHGSMSLKDVLPALTGRGYDELAISDGGMASQEFLRMAFTDISKKEQQSIRRNLEQYCGLDTENMIHIIKALAFLAGR
jgi:hypothetical protein